MFISDRDKLEKELAQIELALQKNTEWTPDISNLYVRREEIRKLLKTMGKKDWL